MKTSLRSKEITTGFSIVRRYQNNMAYMRDTKYARACMTDEQKNWVYASYAPQIRRKARFCSSMNYPDDDYIGTLKSYVKPAQFPEMNPYMKSWMLICSSWDILTYARLRGTERRSVESGQCGTTQNKEQQCCIRHRRIPARRT